MLEAAEALDQEVAQSRNTLAGSLKVSTSHRLGSLHMAPILARLRQQHPSLQVCLNFVREQLTAGEFALDL